MCSSDLPIVCTSSVLGGQPRLKGRRIQVFNAISRIKDDGLDGFLEDADVEEHLASAAIRYCRDRLCLRDNPSIFCSGCTYCLAMQNRTPEEWTERAPVVCSTEAVAGDLDGRRNIFLGSPEDLKQSLKGKDGWTIASELYELYRERLRFPQVPPRQLSPADD